MNLTFNLDAKQQEALNKFIKSLPKIPDGAIGGRLEYVIVPTHIGNVLKVRDTISKAEIDLTDYSMW